MGIGRGCQPTGGLRAGRRRLRLVALGHRNRRETQRDRAVVVDVEIEFRLDQIDPRRHDAAGPYAIDAELSRGFRRRRDEVAVVLVQPHMLQPELEPPIRRKPQHRIVDPDIETRQFRSDGARDGTCQRLQRNRSMHQPHVAEPDREARQQKNRQNHHQQAPADAANATPDAIGRIHGFVVAGLQMAGIAHRRQTPLFGAGPYCGPSGAVIPCLQTGSSCLHRPCPRPAAMPGAVCGTP